MITNQTNFILVKIKVDGRVLQKQLHTNLGELQ